MNNISAVRYRDRLNILFKKIQTIPDLEVQSHWSRYLCILVSSFLETSIPEILTEYTKSKSSSTVYNYVSRNLELRNPNMERIIQLVSHFSKSSGEMLKKETDGKVKDSIDSIYGNRCLIVHGKDTGISFHRISEWYKDAIKLIEKIENIFESI